MTLAEISDLLDTRLNTFDKGVSVDEYEKSLYLTYAQNRVYEELLNVFEANGDVSKDLEPFIKEQIITSTVARTGVIANSIFFNMPSDLRKTVYETVLLSSADAILDGKEIKVIKTKLAEVVHKIGNPFRDPNYEETMRVVTTDEAANSVAEIIQPEGATIVNYKIKYLEEITPIVLEDLSSLGLEIEGVSAATNSKFYTEKLNIIIDLAIGLILQDKVVPKSEKV
jgi:hypothetical protein